MTKHPVMMLSAIALALGVAACGSSASSSSTAKTTSAATTSAATTSPATASTATTTTASSGGMGTETASASNTLTIAANPSGQLMFDEKSMTAKAGKVTVMFTNKAPEDHDFTVQEGTDGKVLGATPAFQGGSRTLVLDLKAGKYTFFCTEPGHRAAGMVGTLTIT